MIKYTEKFSGLVDTIAGYESDTFSAESVKLTREEATEIANKLVCEAISDMIELETLDGDIINTIFTEDIRPE